MKLIAFSVMGHEKIKKEVRLMEDVSFVMLGWAIFSNSLLLGQMGRGPILSPNKTLCQSGGANCHM